MTKTQKIILLSILLAGAFLLFFRLTRHDLMGDDAHYAFRSVEYFDFLSSQEQTTPVQWFGYRPWWSLLSFHENPPLFFLIQHLFFKVFGVSLLVSRLPSALAAWLSILLIFAIGRRLGGVKSGLVAAGALAISSYFIWLGRVGLIENLFILFLLAGLLFLIKSLKHDKNICWAWLFFGLSFLTKYHLFFIMPGIIAFLLWQERRIFINKKFWLGFLLFLIIISPVIFFNVMVYQTRGHLDAQLSELFSFEQNDWVKFGHRLSARSLSLSGPISVLIDGLSWPYMLLFLVSVVCGVTIAKKNNQSLVYLPLLIIISLYLSFAYVGSAVRWLGIFCPFLALIIGYACARLLRNKLIYVGVAVVGLYFLFYTVNTNLLTQKAGGKFFSSAARIENYGYNQLDLEIAKLFSNSRVPDAIQQISRGWWFENTTEQTLNFASLHQGENIFNYMIIYDSNSSWFPMLWIFDRWKISKGAIITNTYEYYKTISKNEVMLTTLENAGFKGVYLIKSGEKVQETSASRFPSIDSLIDFFNTKRVQPKIIYDDKNREAFYLYKIDF